MCPFESNFAFLKPQEKTEGLTFNLSSFILYLQLHFKTSCSSPDLGDFLLHYLSHLNHVIAAVMYCARYHANILFVLTLNLHSIPVS